MWFFALSAGYLQYDALWVGDPILGGFDGRSSAFLQNRVQVSATTTGTWRPSEHHRFRGTLNTRTLRLATVLRPDGALGTVLLSDGVPVDQAVLERGFVDEASWRWRPRGDRSVDLRVGMLPFQLAAGRLLVESWPGARLQIAPGPWGGPPIVADLRGAVRTDGSVQGALSVRREWSAFEWLGLEVAGLWDRNGVAPLIADDASLVIGTFGRANAPFLDANGTELQAWLADTYLAEPYGVDRLVFDARTFLDLGGRATLGYGTLMGAGLVGPVWLDGVLIGSVGGGTVQGNRVPDGAPWVTPPDDWPTTVPRDRWDHGWASISMAWDLLVEVPGRPVAPFAFFQGASGDADIVATSEGGDVVRAFLAPDQRLLRTRVFPVDAASRGGAWSMPPGVAGYGLVSVGGGAQLSGDPGGIKAQVARPWSWVGTCLGCADGARPRRGYGVEGDVLAWLDLGAVRPTADVGAFVPGPFFLDDTDPERDGLADLPVGWRVYLGVGIATP